MRTLAIRPGALLGAMLLGACTIGTGTGQQPFDASAVDGTQLLVTFGDVPSRTPESTVAVRGTAPRATRVVFLWEPGQVQAVTPLFSTGDFCVDLPLKTNAATIFHVYAQGDAATSDPRDLTITQDPAAPVPTDPTCTHQVKCMPTSMTEICGNGIDDNCNGMRDGCDPACNGNKTCEETGGVCGANDKCVCDSTMCRTLYPADHGRGACCSGACVQLSYDPANCNRCGNDCPPNYSCIPSATSPTTSSICKNI